VAGSPAVVRAETPQQGVCPLGERHAQPDPSRVEKRTASRCYQLKSGHALTGVYLKSTDNRPYDPAGGATQNNSGTQQTRDHHFKHCYKWKVQQAEVQGGGEEGEAEVARGRPAGG